MKQKMSKWLIAGMLMGSSAMAATEIKGVKLSDSYQLSGQALQLNGAGVRSKFFVSVYVAGLYLPRKEQSATNVLGGTGPKSVQIVMLREVSGTDFAESTLNGFKANHSAEELARFQPKLNELLALMRTFGEVKKGTSINIDLLPSGVRIAMNGQPKGDVAADEAFCAAVLRNWLGSNPVDGDLKKSLLGA